MDLAEVQAHLQAYLLAPKRNRGRLAALFTEPPDGSLERRLDLYAGSVRAKAVQRWQSHYPRVAALTGRVLFRELAEAHLASSRPGERADDLLRSFPAFLERCAARHGCRADLGALALLELARHELAQLPDPVALQARHLEGRAAEDLAGRRVRFVAGIERVETPFDVSALWDPDNGAGAAYPLAPGRTVHLVWKHAGEVLHRVLDADEQEALHRAAAGVPLGALPSSFAHCDDPQGAMQAAFLGWVQDGLVAALD